MEKFVAVVFDTENAAYKGAEALRGLHRNGDLTVNAAAVVAKDEYGTVQLKKTVDEGPIGTFFGLGIGALIGLLAAPAAVASGAAIAGTAAVAQAAAGGMALGGMTGGVLGAFRDIDVAEVDTAALNDVSNKLEPGKTCLIASIEESWTTPLDSRMNELGGTVHRKSRFFAAEEYYDAEARALDAELTALNEELRQTHADNKAAVQEKIDQLKTRIRENNEKIEARINTMNDNFDDKIREMDAKIEASHDEKREKLRQQRVKIETEHAERKERLQSRIKVADAVLAA